jgi:hypothetical protein
MTSQRLTSMIEDVQFNADVLAGQYDNDCQWLVALSDWQISVIISALRYAEWQSRWLLGSHTWDEIEAQISQLEYCLMAGCNVEELLDKFDTLNGYMMTLVSRFVTPEGANIAEVTEDQVLTSICSPNVNVDVNCGSGGCGGGCDNPPSQPGTEGGTPPENWTDPPENEDPEFDRKCRVSNMMYDGLYQVIDQFNKNDLENIITTLGIGTAVGVIAAVLAIITGPIGFGLAIVGVVTGIALTFIGQSIDLDELLTILDENHQELVCALYNSTDAETAIDDFIEVLTDGGANTAQEALVRAIFIIDAANALFFTPDNSNGDKLEADLDGYISTVDCTSCYDGWTIGNSYDTDWGTLISGSLDRDTVGFTVESKLFTEQANPEELVWLIPPPGACFEISLSCSGRTPSPHYIEDFKYYLCDGTQVLTDTVSLDHVCIKRIDPEPGEGSINITGDDVSSHFTVTVTVHGTCTE